MDALLGSRGKKLFQTAPNTSKQLEIGFWRQNRQQGLEILVTTSVGFKPDPLLLTVVRSLGFVRADFLAFSHRVPGTASSKVKKIFQV